MSEKERYHAVQKNIQDLLARAADKSAGNVVSFGSVLLAAKLQSIISQSPYAQIPEPAIPVQECAMVDCHSEAVHECPSCHKLYCDECHDLFLPIDPAFWVATAMMCSSCSYGSQEV